MPAMDSCNIVEFPVATMEFSLATFILQQIITTTLPTYDLAFDYTIPCSCKEGYCESPVETPCTDMREAMTVLDCPPFRSMSTLLRAFARDLAGAHDVFAYDRTVRMNLLYVLGVTVLAGVLNLLFKNTPAMPTRYPLSCGTAIPPSSVESGICCAAYPGEEVDRVWPRPKYEGICRSCRSRHVSPSMALVQQLSCGVDL